MPPEIFVKARLSFGTHSSPSQPQNSKNYLSKKKNSYITHGGQIYLYSEPERYINHSTTPNTVQDLGKQGVLHYET